jgi:ectoine hydroxylase-related dioxygenase (phytanoyl-CoA dioxygenase family)
MPLELFHAQRDPAWLEKTLKNLARDGFAVVEGVLDKSLLQWTREAMYRVRDEIQKEVGTEKLERAGEMGVLRLMMRFEPGFTRFLELPELLSIVDSTVSSTSVMHLQNGFILPSHPQGHQPQVFQNQFHMDFPRVLNGYMASVNCFFAIDAFTRTNGATLVVPGSHQKPERPNSEEMLSQALPVECPEGSMIVFDSTLYHAAGANTSGKDRLSINHQFTRSYFKQQLDYVRALGDQMVLGQKPRSQQLLGWYTRIPTSLTDYYQPEAQRFYRKGQG